MVLVSKQTRRSRPVAQKRRSGHHHKKDDQYLKPYWPYIPMVLIVAAGMVFSSLWGVAQNNVLGYATDMTHTGLLASTNDKRVAHSLGTLAINAQLNQAAQAKANDMVARNYWAHNTPDGDAPWVFFKAAGYDYATAGENLAYGFTSSEATVVAWMNSPPHKENVLGANYTEVGFGFANSANFNNAGEETIVVAMYGSRNAAPVAATPAPAPAATKPAETTTPTPTPAATEPTPEQKAAEQPTEPKQKPAEPNATANPATNLPPASTTPTTDQSITRIQLVAGNQATWSAFVVSTLAVVCVAVFILRHGLFWHRMLVKGEKFVIHHKALDIALVAIVVIAMVVTRSAGVIH